MNFVLPQYKQLVTDVNVAKVTIYVAPSIVWLPLKAHGAQTPVIKNSQGQTEAGKSSLADLFEVRDNLLKDLQKDPSYQEAAYAQKLKQQLQKYILMINFLSANRIDGAEFGWKDYLFGDPKVGKRSTYKTQNFFADASQLGMCVTFYFVQIAQALAGSSIQEGLAPQQLKEVKDLLIGALEIIEYCRVYFVPKSGSQYSMDIQQQSFVFLSNMILGDLESILLQQLIELKATPERISNVAFAAVDNYEEALRNFKMTLKQELQVKSSRNSSTFKMQLQDKYVNYLQYKYSSLKAAGYAFKGLDYVNKQQDIGDAVRFGQESVRLLNGGQQFAQKYDRSEPITKPDGHMQLDKTLKYHVNYAATKIDKDNKSIFYQKVPESLPAIQRASPIYSANANEFEAQVQELSRSFSLPNIEQIIMQEQQQAHRNGLHNPSSGQSEKMPNQPSPFSTSSQQGPDNRFQQPQNQQNYNQNPQQYNQQQPYIDYNQPVYSESSKAQQTVQQGFQNASYGPPPQQGYSNMQTYPTPDNHVQGNMANGFWQQSQGPQNSSQPSNQFSNQQINNNQQSVGANQGNNRVNNDINPSINQSQGYAKPEKASCNCFGGRKAQKKQAKQEMEQQKQNAQAKQQQLEQAQGQQNQQNQPGGSQSNFISSQNNNQFYS